MRCLALLGVVALAFALPSQAAAGNDDSVFVGNGAAMTGGAVTATVGEASALYYNPAGLGLVDRDEVDLNAQAIGIRFYLVPDLVSTTDGRGSDESSNEILSIPAGLGYVRPLSEHFVVGLGLFSPQARDLLVREELRDDEGPDTGSIQLAVNDTSSVIDITVGGAWRPSEKLRLGLSLLIGYNSKFQTQQYFVGATTADYEFAIGLSNTFSQKLFDAQLRLGAQWNPVPELSLGLMIASPSVALAGFSRETEGSLTAVTAPGTEGSTDLTGSDDGSFEFSFESFRPAQIRAGAAYRFDDVTLAIDGTLMSALSNSALSVDRHLEWNLRVGGVYSFDEDTQLGLGFYTDRGGESDPFFGGGPIHFYGTSLALHTRTHVSLGDEEEADDLVFGSYIGLRYALGFGQITGLRFSPGADFDDLLALNSVDITVHEVFLHIGSSVDF